MNTLLLFILKYISELLYIFQNIVLVVEMVIVAGSVIFTEDALDC